MPMPQTANFTSGGPDALQQQALSQEQALLLQRLQEQQQGLAPPVTNSGRLNVLNLEGLANSIGAARSKKELEINQKKQADLLGASQKALLEELARYDPQNPESVRSARFSNNPQLRAVGESDAKAAAEKEKEARAAAAAGLKELLARGTLPSAIKAVQTQNPAELQPRETQTVGNGMVIGTAEGQPPRVIAGQRTAPAPMPGVGMAQTNPFTGEVDQLNKAPSVKVNVDAGTKAGVKFLEDEAAALSKRATTLRETLPQQLSALSRAEETAQSGAMQGPTSKYRALAVGFARELGVTGEDLNELLANTEKLDSDMGKFVLANVKLLGANPSNADREYSERTAGGKQLSPEGLAAVIRAAKADILTSANMHNTHVGTLATRFPDAELARVRLPSVVAGPRKSANEISLPGYTMSEDGRYVRDLPKATGGSNPAVDAALNKYLPKGK